MVLFDERVMQADARTYRRTQIKKSNVLRIEVNRNRFIAAGMFRCKHTHTSTKAISSIYAKRHFNVADDDEADLRIIVVIIVK